MRHLKADVSHRMKRRPSIFTARWFRVILGLGAVVIVGLLLGPSITGWLRGDGRPAPLTARATPRPSAPKAAPAIAPDQPAPRESAAPAPAARAEPPAPTPQRAASVPPDPPAANGASPATELPRPAPDKADAVVTAKPVPSGATVRGPVVYRIQLGAFLDHRNADRLIERLRNEGVEVVNTNLEESRPLYRVLAVPQEGEGYPLVVERLRALGFTPEPTEGGAVVTRPAPLAAAVELSRRLRDQGIRVRLERQASGAGFRVVRVGAYDTAEEAERARAELAGRGHEGVVIREPREPR